MRLGPNDAGKNSTHSPAVPPLLPNLIPADRLALMPRSMLWFVVGFGTTCPPPTWPDDWLSMKPPFAVCSAAWVCHGRRLLRPYSLRLPRTKTFCPRLETTLLTSRCHLLWCPCPQPRKVSFRPNRRYRPYHRNRWLLKPQQRWNPAPRPSPWIAILWIAGAIVCWPVRGSWRTPCLCSPMRRTCLVPVSCWPFPPCRNTGA